MECLLKPTKLYQHFFYITLFGNYFFYRSNPSFFSEKFISTCHNNVVISGLRFYLISKFTDITYGNKEIHFDKFLHVSLLPLYHRAYDSKVLIQHLTPINQFTFVFFLKKMGVSQTTALQGQETSGTGHR